ncbi:hypothetical protein ACVI1I_006367 [Bradyrhizobium sp. USDA 4459]
MPNLVRSQQLEKKVIGSAKRRLKCQMQPVKALMRGALIGTPIVWRVMPPASDRVHESWRSPPWKQSRCSPAINGYLFDFVGS